MPRLTIVPLLALAVSCTGSSGIVPGGGGPPPADAPPGDRPPDAAPPAPDDASADRLFPDGPGADRSIADGPGADGSVADGPGADRSVADAGTSAAFAAVQAIFALRCVRCHDPAHPFVPESPTFVQLPLTPDAAYEALVGRPAHEACGGVLVTPTDPGRSYLFHKVNDQVPCEGLRMPHGGMLRPQPLPAAEIAAINTWIHGGALR
jgi:hypothetical protein